MVHPYVSHSHDGIVFDVATCMAQIADLKNAIDKLLVGPRAIIQSDYNDQPIGRSRKSLRGEIVVIRETWLAGERLSIFVEGHRCGMGLDELRIIEEKQS